MCYPGCGACGIAHTPTQALVTPGNDALPNAVGHMLYKRYRYPPRLDLGPPKRGKAKAPHAGDMSCRGAPCQRPHHYLEVRDRFPPPPGLCGHGGSAPALEDVDSGDEQDPAASPLLADYGGGHAALGFLGYADDT